MEREVKRVTEAPSDVARQQAKDIVVTILRLQEEQRVLASDLRKKLEEFRKENSGHVDKLGRDIVSLEDAAKRIVGSRAFRAMKKNLKQEIQAENKKSAKLEVPDRSFRDEERDFEDEAEQKLDE